MSHLAAWSKGGSRTGCSYRIAATAPSIDEVLKGREVRPCRPDPPSGSSSATSSSSARWGSADRSRSLATCNAISWTSVGAPDDYKQGLALAQLAPGPLAAQLAIYLGWVRGRVLGATLVG